MTARWWHHRRVVMKLPALLLVAALVPACAKTNDVPALRARADEIAAYYKPKFDFDANRVLDIVRRANVVPKNMVGADEAQRAGIDARDELMKLQRELVEDPKAAHKIADDETKSIEERTRLLERFVHDEQRRLDEGSVFVDENLSEIESWLEITLRNAPPGALQPVGAAPASLSAIGDATSVP